MSDQEQQPPQPPEPGESDLAPVQPGNPQERGLPQFVTVLTPMEQQIGLHTISALQHPETVAVLTSVAMGRDGAQRIVSIGLDQELLGKVQELIIESREEHTQRVPCVGFHCVLEDRDRADRPEGQENDE